MNYKTKYLKHYGYGLQDLVCCKVCGQEAHDIHHIKYRSQGGTDDIKNLVALCRTCHEKAHKDNEFNERLKDGR